MRRSTLDNDIERLQQTIPQATGENHGSASDAEDESDERQHKQHLIQDARPVIKLLQQTLRKYHRNKAAQYEILEPIYNIADSEFRKIILHNKTSAKFTAAVEVYELLKYRDKKNRFESQKWPAKTWTKLFSEQSDPDYQLTLRAFALSSPILAIQLHYATIDTGGKQHIKKEIRKKYQDIIETMPDRLFGLDITPFKNANNLQQPSAIMVSVTHFVRQASNAMTNVAQLAEQAYTATAARARGGAQDAYQDTDVSSDEIVLTSTGTTPGQPAQVHLPPGPYPTDSVTVHLPGERPPPYPGSVKAVSQPANNKVLDGSENAAASSSTAQAEAEAEANANAASTATSNRAMVHATSTTGSAQAAGKTHTLETHSDSDGDDDDAIREESILLERFSKLKRPSVATSSAALLSAPRDNTDADSVAGESTAPVAELS